MLIRTSFLIFFTLLLSITMSNTLSAQLALPLADSDSLILTTAVPTLDKKVSYPDLETLILQSDTPNSTFSIQKNQVYSQYGFFCKQEAIRDKKTNIPVRVRLGCLQTVNQKEYGRN